MEKDVVRTIKIQICDVCGKETTYLYKCDYCGKDMCFKCLCERWDGGNVDNICKDCLDVVNKYGDRIIEAEKIINDLNKEIRLECARSWNEAKD